MPCTGHCIVVFGWDVVALHPEDYQNWRMHVDDSIQVTLYIVLPGSIQRDNDHITIERILGG